MPTTTTLLTTVEPRSRVIPADKWGWAVQAGLQIKNIPTGAGDTINLQAVYTDGNSRRNFQSLVGQNFAMYGGTNVPGAYQSVGLAAVVGRRLRKRKRHCHGSDLGYARCVEPQLRSLLERCDLRCIRPAEVWQRRSCYRLRRLAKLVQPPLASPPATRTSTSAQIGGIIRWTPVKNLTFSADVTYTMLDQKHVGVLVAARPSWHREAGSYLPAEGPGHREHARSRSA